MYLVNFNLHNLVSWWLFSLLLILTFCTTFFFNPNFFFPRVWTITFKNVIGYEGSTSDTIVLLQQVRNWSFCFVKWAWLFLMWWNRWSHRLNIYVQAVSISSGQKFKRARVTISFPFRRRRISTFVWEVLFFFFFKLHG